jgi:hypothetical protein
MLFWPGVDKWPPPKEVVIAAVVMTFVAFPIALLLGVVGQVIFGAIVVAAIVLGMHARLKHMNVRAEELKRAGPDD